jgi:anti-anti-sigma factor
MSGEFTIELLAVNQHTAVFFAAGAVNIETAPVLLDSIDEVIEKHTPRSIVIDIDKVPYISSSGVAALMQIFEKIRDNDGIIILVKIHESIKRILSILGFTRYFLYATSMDEAHQILLDHFAEK